MSPLRPSKRAELRRRVAELDATPLRTDDDVVEYLERLLRVAELSPLSAGLVLRVAARELRRLESP